MIKHVWSQLITVCDEEVKKQILRYAAKLKHISAWTDVFVSPDLTFSERQANKILHEKFKNRRDQSETNLTIRNGKIIQRQRSSAPQSWLNLEYSTLTQNDFQSAQVISTIKLKVISLNCRSQEK